jgi:hypothetical protein
MPRRRGLGIPQPGGAVPVNFVVKAKTGIHHHVHMKYPLNIIVACLLILVAAPSTHDEELQDFLKRIGLGNATTNDIHENFQKGKGVEKAKR